LPPDAIERVTKRSAIQIAALCVMMFAIVGALVGVLAVGARVAAIAGSVAAVALGLMIWSERHLNRDLKLASGNDAIRRQFKLAKRAGTISGCSIALVAATDIVAAMNLL
jgi:hypothetical protein